MTCRCGFVNTAAAERCGRCGSLVRHTPLDVHPPRAGRFSRLRVWARRHLRFRPSGEASVRRSLAGLVPGLGHALEDVPLGAAAVAFAQAALLAQAAYFAGTAWGRIVMGLLVFNHAFSMIDLSRRTLARMNVWRRVRSAATLALLPMLIYGPAFVLSASASAVAGLDNVAGRGIIV